jgi:VanZ like family
MRRPAARRTAPASAGPVHHSRPAAPELSEALVRSCCVVGLVWSLLLVGVATLTPEGTGWRWGDPLTELQWYATGAGTPSTMVELVGNLALLALPAAFAVRIWPRLGRLPVLISVALAAGTSIETLQWVLAIGRVVSPVDALLNATGAVLAASWVTRFRRGRAPRRWHAVL